MLFEGAERQTRMVGDPHDRSPAKVAQAIRGRGGRSPLYVWMWENYAELSAAKVPGRRSDWISAAEEVRRMGIKSERGGKVSAETMRRTWANVDKNAKAIGWNGNPEPPGASVPTTARTQPVPHARLSTPPLRPPIGPGGHSDPDSDDDEPKIVLKRVTRQE